MKNSESDLVNNFINKDHNPVKKNIFTISNEYPFIETIVLGFEKKYGKNKNLKDLTILLPNLRAVLSFNNQLKSSGFTNKFMPKVYSYGYIDEKESRYLEKNSDLKQAYIENILKNKYLPSISALEKKIILTKLAIQWGERSLKNGPVNLSVALQLAEEVSLILDKLQANNKSLEDYSNIFIPEFFPNIEKAGKFFQIISNSWPKILKEKRLCDSVQRHNNILEDYCTNIDCDRRNNEIIAVGLLGSMKSEEFLLKTIANLPNGKIIFLGLDIFVNEKEWQMLKETHPQYGYQKLIKEMHVDRKIIAEWIKVANKNYKSRSILIRESMKQAELTQNWKNLELKNDVEKDLNIFYLENMQEEAIAIATVIREEIKKNKTISLITYHKDLVRRVAVDLKNSGIIVNCSSFDVYKNSNFVIFFRLIGEMVRSNFDPVSLLAVLKHPLASGGQCLEDFKKNVFNFEKFVIRGSLFRGGLENYKDLLEEKNKKHHLTDEYNFGNLVVWFDSIVERLSALLDVINSPKNFFLNILIEHIRFSTWLASSANSYVEKELLSNKMDPTLTIFFENLMKYVEVLGEIRSINYFHLLEYLLEDNYESDSKNSHHQISILKPDEAQFQQSDLKILGGLNENVWPEKQSAKYWLPHALQKKIGLQSNEELIGVSAHNFCQMVSVSEVVLTRSEKIDGISTVPSRWLGRIEALLSKRKSKVFFVHSDLKEKYGLKDFHIDVVSYGPPEFSPPINARPRNFSISDIEHLMNNPYRVLVERIMNIKPLPEIIYNLSNKDLGVYAHVSLQKFVEAYNYKLPQDALKKFLDVNYSIIGKISTEPVVRTFWLRHFEKIGEWFIGIQRKKEKISDIIATEVLGKYEFSLSGKTYTLTAKADRIDKKPNGSLIIIDYKTGSIPAWKSVKLGETPQLPLEALIAESGGFRNVPANKVDEISYWKLSGVAENSITSNCKVDELIKSTLQGLVELIEVFNKQDTAYLFNPWSLKHRFNEYDHLSRYQEWTKYLKEKDF